jgi:hypothetical protein
MRTFKRQRFRRLLAHQLSAGMGLDRRMLGAGRWDERDRAAGGRPAWRCCRCALWLQALRRRGLASEPGELRHVMGQISDASLHRCPDDADGAHCQCHRLFLSDNDVFGGRAHARFARIGPPRPRCHRRCRPRHRRLCYRHRSPPPVLPRHGRRRGSLFSRGSGRAGDRSRHGSCSQRPARQDRPAASHPRAAWPWRTSPSSARRGPSGGASQASPPSLRGSARP